jgi:hypothetical protein
MSHTHSSEAYVETSVSDTPVSVWSARQTALGQAAGLLDWRVGMLSETGDVRFQALPVFNRRRVAIGAADVQARWMRTACGSGPDRLDSPSGAKIY